MMLTSLVLLALLTLSPIELKVTPQAGMAPLAVRITVTVEPNDLNHELCIDWDSADYSGGSCQTMDGERFPKTTNKVVALMSGEYTFHATLFRSDNTTVSSPLVRVIVQ